MPSALDFYGVTGKPPATPSMGSLTPPPASTPGGPMAASPMPMAMPAAGGAAVLPSYKDNQYGVRPDINIHQMTGYLMDKVRNVESTNNYKADRRTINPKDSASGAYGYTDSTWNNYKGYPRAVLAPPEVQDERMANDTFQRLIKFKGDPFKTIAGHYLPAVADQPHKWSSSGNALSSTAQYLSRVFPPNVVSKYLSKFNQSSPSGGPAIQYTGQGRP